MKKTRMTTGEWVLLVLGFALGYAIWAFSPLFTGHVEPWDAPGSYLTVSMFLSGALLGLLSPRRFLLWAVAVTLGPLPHVGFGIFSQFGPLTLLFLIVAGIPSLIGSAAGAGLRFVIPKLLLLARW